MTDLKILSIRDLLPITAVEYASKVTPLSLIIQGENFDQATKVLINDLEAPEYLIVSSGRLVAQVPTSERASIVRSVAVLAEQPSVKRSSVLSFSVGPSFRALRGIEKLVQIFCKLLLQTPGSDKFNPADGGGLLSAVGRNVARAGDRTMQTLIASAVNRTRDQILAKQHNNARIPADERLLSAQADAVGYDHATTTASARVLLSAVSGRQAVANLTF